MGNGGDAGARGRVWEEPYGCPPYSIATCWTPDVCVRGGDSAFLSLSHPAQARREAPTPLLGTARWLDKLLPLKNLMMSVKSMLLSRIISR